MPAFDIFRPKASVPDMSVTALFELPIPALVKDGEGRFIDCNQTLADLAGVSLPQAMQGATDLDFSWREYADIYKKHDQAIEKSSKPNFFIEPTLNSKNEVIEILSIKAPITGINTAMGGFIGASIPLNNTSFNTIFSQFLQISELLKLELDSCVMIRIITKAIQLNEAINQWDSDRRLFDYKEVKFSLREAQCLHYFFNGYSAEQTAKKLFISKKTVEFHLATIKLKKNCSHKSQITNKAIDWGLLI